MSPYVLLLPVLIPVIGGFITSRIHALQPRRIIVSCILMLQLVVTASVCLADPVLLNALELAPGVRIVLQNDPLANLFAMLICLIWFVVALFAFEYMNHEGHRERFFGFYLITLGALMGVCYAGNLVTLYMFYEMMTICSVPLVLHIGTKKAFEAAWKYLAFSVVGAAMGLLGLFVLQGYCTTDLFTPGGVLDLAAAGENSTLLLIIFLIMAIGFGCKAGMFPLHAWLPIAILWLRLRLPLCCPV